MINARFFTIFFNDFEKLSLFVSVFMACATLGGCLGLSLNTEKTKKFIFKEVKNNKSVKYFFKLQLTQNN